MTSTMRTTVQLPEGVSVDTEPYRFALGTYPDATADACWYFKASDGREVSLNGPLAEVVEDLEPGRWTVQP
jgi:hypothetical protein